MRSIFAVSVFLATSIAVTGCALDSGDADDESLDDTGEALSATGSKLVGAYRTSNAASDFDVLVLKSDGSYFAEEHVVCVTTPCPPIRQEGRFIAHKAPKHGFLGGLRLLPKGGAPSTYYRVSFGAPNQSFKLSRDGVSFWAYAATTSRTYCATASDCSGQSYIRPMCVGQATCDTSTAACGWKCGVPAPVCDYTSSTKTYIGRSTDQCAVIRFFCEPGTQYFADSCGCGCEKSPPAPCYVGGCSSHVCSASKNVMTTCEFRPEYACYRTATCERDATGACGWKKTPALTSCLASPPS